MQSSKGNRQACGAFRNQNMWVGVGQVLCEINFQFDGEEKSGDRLLEDESTTQVTSGWK